MKVEFIGIAHTSDYSETNAASGPVIQPDYLYRLARVHEQSGFDRVLVAHSSAMPDGFTVASQILNATERLGVLLAHRPGFVSPTVAARKYATIDAFHPGRIALHVITGGDDGDQARDGDFSDKPTRYRRTDEFLDLVKLEWSSAQRFDYDGEFYRVKGALSAVRPEGGHLRRPVCPRFVLPIVRMRQLMMVWMWKPMKIWARRHPRIWRPAGRERPVRRRRSWRPVVWSLHSVPSSPPILHRCP